MRAIWLFHAALLTVLCAPAYALLATTPVTPELVQAAGRDH
jgi:hypothetical protein